MPFHRWRDDDNDTNDDNSMARQGGHAYEVTVCIYPETETEAVSRYIWAGRVQSSRPRKESFGSFARREGILLQTPPSFALDPASGISHFSGTCPDPADAVRCLHRLRRAPLPRQARMTTSRRLADRKSAKFQKNITKRGSVPETTVKKGNDYPVGPIVLGFFIFVVIGSSLFQIIRTATSGGMA
ncbi:uncharacterized protein LOC123396430 [Hordeum vulgare subsp. vulgare]|nr:uncharacterized protein LOC123396430 [Hordeum vulgare subsp. vulgare]